MSELHEAASLGDLERLEEALTKGADPNEPDPEWTDRTALHIAAANGSKKCVYMLLQAGADCNAVTTNGWTPAHFACESGQLGCLQSLMSLGCDVTIKDSSGDTAQQVAQVYGHTHCYTAIAEKFQTEHTELLHKDSKSLNDS